MIKFTVIFVFSLLVVCKVNCGVFARNGNPSGHIGRSSGKLFVAKRNNLLLTTNNVGVGNINKNISPERKMGSSTAWGLISVIIVAIVMCFAGYYGLLCYPLLCKNEKHYDIVDELSTTGTSFESYSPRSITPNKNHT